LIFLTNLTRLRLGLGARLAEAVSGAASVLGDALPAVGFEGRANQAECTAAR
jgi:hypothetical protein